MSKLIVVANDKGGVGKTNTSLALCYVLKSLEKDFRLVEIDSSQDSSEFLSKSELKDNLLSVDTKGASEELYKALFELLQNEDMTIVIDAGGSEDSRAVINMVKKLEYENTSWLIPIQNSKKQQPNLENTYNLIDKPNNTYVVKNQVQKDDAYIFFEGSKRLSQKSMRDKLNLENNVFEIPASPLFEIAEAESHTLFDASSLAMTYSAKEAQKAFMAKNDPEYFVEMMSKFRISEDSFELLSELKNQFEEFLND